MLDPRSQSVVMLDSGSASASAATRHTCLLIADGPGVSCSPSSCLQRQQPQSLTLCCACFADPAPVASFRCEVVPKKPTLVLKWACPSGTNTGFELEVSRGDWRNMTYLEGCSSEDGAEYRTEVTSLNFSALYDINITALSCNKRAPPIQNTCLTGITGGLCGGRVAWWHCGYL